MSTDRTLLIVGLGNPGKEYAQSRHNAGFMVLDALSRSEVVKPVERNGLGWEMKKDLLAELATTTVQGTKLLLAKPTTFMNLSGKSVAAILAFYKLSPEHLWVVHDDLDLSLGKAQIRKGGGLAGHHGLESIAQTLKTPDFCRVRVGIRGQELRSYHQEQGIDTNDFVMGNFTDKEKDILSRIIDEVVRTMAGFLHTKHVSSHMLTVDGYETFQGKDS